MLSCNYGQQNNNGYQIWYKLSRGLSVSHPYNRLQQKSLIREKAEKLQVMSPVLQFAYTLLTLSCVARLTAGTCGTCAEGNGECVGTTCWCVADKGGAECATACGSACADGEVCAGTLAAPTCVACPTGAAACVNGGVCASKAADAAAYCRCAAGLTGAACETVDCTGTSPCLNGGTCNDTPDPDTCTCVAGYTGQICDQDIDECLSDPCQNDGTCTDAVNGYTCTCPTDYTGVHCENIDECLSNPCQNDGTCTDAMNGYTCTCPTDYTGVHCESGASRIATALSLMLAALFIFKSIN